MSDTPRWLVAARMMPAVTVLVLLSLLGMFAGFFWPLPRWLTFGGLQSGEYWRLVTPIFVHFGVMHFVFNSLWLFVLGGRIERIAGPGHLLLLVLVSGIVSNFSQYYWSGSAMFGGMSGVIYALLGYLWIRNLVAPHPMLEIPNEIIGFMLVWLLLCMSGVMTFLLGVGIANAAHLGGLLVGMLLGLLFGLVSRAAPR